MSALRSLFWTTPDLLVPSSACGGVGCSLAPAVVSPAAGRCAIRGLGGCRGSVLAGGRPPAVALFCFCVELQRAGLSVYMFAFMSGICTPFHHPGGKVHSNV